MDTVTGMSGINDDIVYELLDALDMAMPDAPEGGVGTAAAATFADVMQATFQWNPAEADSNLQLFFPHFQTYAPAVPQELAGRAEVPCYRTPFAGQQQQQTQQQQTQQQQVWLPKSNPLPVAGAASNLHGSHAAIASPFAGIDASILRQPAAPVAAPPEAAQYAAPVRAACAAMTGCAGAYDTAHRQQQQQHQQQQEQHQQQQGEHELHSQQQPTTKRGRPQKVAGLYSKGYSTILKYRQRKKDMVSSMEQEVADKLALLQQLQAQQQALLHKQAALQNSLGAQAALSGQLEALRVSVGPAHSAKHPVSGEAAGFEQVPAVRATARAADQQQERQQQLLEASALLQRYKQYIFEAAARLSADSSGGCTCAAAGDASAGDAGANDGAAAGPASVHHAHDDDHHHHHHHHQQQQQQDGRIADADSFPRFPFNLVEVLSLWKVSQLLGLPNIDVAGGSSSAESGSGAAAAGAGTESDVSLNAGMVNLETFEHDVVPMSKWVHVAQQLHVQPQQREQLNAAWQLFTAAIDKLNMQRQQLVKQLQAKLQDSSTTAAAATAAAVGAPAADAAQPYTATLAGAAARIGPSALVSSSSSSGAACVCSPLSGSDLQGYADLADAVEWNLVRGRAMVMLYGWAMMCVLGRQQVGALCVASWPHFPLVRAVAGVLVAGADQQQQRR